MRTIGWAALAAIGAVSILAACSDSDDADVSQVEVATGGASSSGGSGTGGSKTKLVAAEEDGMAGATSMGQGGALVIDGGVICDRFIVNDDPRTASVTALEHVSDTYPGYIPRDCRIRGFSENIDVFADIANQAYDLTMYLWGCEGFEYEDYDPSVDFPLLHSSWQASEEDVGAFIDAYMAKLKNSGLGFNDFELSNFRAKVEELAEGAADPGLSGYTRSRCDDGPGGLGGAGGVGGAGGASGM